MLLPRIQRRWTTPALWAGAVLVFATTFFPYAHTRHYPLFLGIVLVQMATYMIWNILHATLLHLLGLRHEKLTYRFNGRDFRLTDVAGNVLSDLIA